MNVTQPKTNISFSGSIPKFYDDNLGSLFFEPYSTEMALRIKDLKADSILEIACGTGRLTKYLPLVTAKKYGSITATDLNPAMLEHAKRTIAWKDIDWQVVDAMELPYGDSLFDVVVAQFGVMFYPDKQKAYNETRRVLSDNGTFIFSAWDSLEHNPISQLTDTIIAEFFPRDTPGFYKIPFSYFSEDEIRSDLAASGFKTINVESLKLEGYAASAHEAAEGLLQGTPLFNAIVERDKGVLPAMIEKLAQKISVLYGDADLSIPLQANIVTAGK
jgi:ubiquinone/menaquinone biosynthesis C-methylase UbiE